MLNFNTLNDDAVNRVIEIDKKLHEDNVKGEEMTRLMFEQMLRGLYITQPFN